MTNNNTFKYMNTAIAAAAIVSGVAVAAPHATEASQGYPDVEKGDYFYDAVMDLTGRGVINGYPGGTYAPERNVTRGEIAKILVKALDLDTKNVTDPKFTDVPTTHKYYKEIAALANAGYIQGFEDHSYRSDEQITRNHMALIIADAYGLNTNDSTKIPFTDLQDSYKEAISALYSNDVTKGMTDTTFGGKSKVTRGQIAEFVVRAEKANNPTVVVSEVTETSISTNKGDYAFATELASIFTKDNAAALKDAEMKVKIENGKVVEIQSLSLNASGTETEQLVFDGGNAVVDGDVIVNADHLSLKNVKVNGNVVLSDQVKSNFTSDGVEISGELIVADEAQAPVAAAGLFTLAATNNAKIDLTNTTVNALNVQRDQIVLASNTKLPEVKLAEKVASIELNSQVGLVTVNHSSLQITGSGSIDKVNVAQSGGLTLGLTGKVSELAVANKDSKITLGENVAVEKLVVPADAALSEMIADYDAVKGKITEVVDNSGSVVDPSAIEVNSIDTLRSALANEQVQTINLTADIKDVTERIVVGRAVKINGNGHTISFTGDLNSSAYGTRHGIAVEAADDVVINDLTVAMTAQDGWQGAYALQVYDAHNVTLHNVSASGADAAIVVNASEVELTGTTTVSGNEFGGIEVSRGSLEGLSDSSLVVSGTIANADEAYGEPTIWLVHNQDTAKTAQGTVSGEGVSDAVINYIDKADGYQTQYYLEAAPVQSLSAVKLEADTYKIEVSAEAADLYELEVDHNIAGLPEFSVYADAANPYGSVEAKSQFDALGVTVAYDEAAKTWTIDFGPTVSTQLAAQDNATFYFVAADKNNYTFGSMYKTTADNTFKF